MKKLDKFKKAAVMTAVMVSAHSFTYASAIVDSLVKGLTYVKGALDVILIGGAVYCAFKIAMIYLGLSDEPKKNGILYIGSAIVALAIWFGIDTIVGTGTTKGELLK